MALRPVEDGPAKQIQGWLTKLEDVNHILTEASKIGTDIIGPRLKESDQAYADPACLSDRMTLSLSNVEELARLLCDQMQAICKKF